LPQDLQSVLRHCKKDLEFRRLIAEGRVVLLCFGSAGTDLADMGVPAIPFGPADSDERIKDMYSAADLFFLLSREDGTSGEIVRALGFGTPVVAFQTGAITDIVAHGVNGLVVPEFDTDRMAEAVLNLVLSPDRRRIMGQKGGRKIAAEQSFSVQAGNYLSLFDDIRKKRSKLHASDRARTGHPATGPVRLISSTGPHIQEVMLKILLKPLEDQIDALRQQVKAGEIDNAEKMDLINSLRMQKDYLETFDGSLKIMIKKILIKLGLFNFALRYRKPAARLYRMIRKRPDLPAAPISSPAAAGITPDAAINSPLVEALVVARSLGGGLDEESLLNFFQLGSEVQNVLCVQPTEKTIQALYMLSRAGAKVTCLDWQHRPEGIRAHGFAVYEGNLTNWMISIGNSTLASYDCLVLDQLKDVRDADILRGRLGQGTRILASSEAGSRLRKGLPAETPVRNVGPLELFDAFPPIWMDSIPEGIGSCQKQDWPLRTPTIKPACLSSGRPWPKISVVTVTYNQGRYLEETIRSVLLQGYPNLEYIVIDGGSTDNTRVILDRYRHELAYCLSEKDNGQSDALNKGFRKATGDILAWLNSDDRYMPWTLWRVAHAFDVYEADMVAGGCALVHSDGRMSFRTHHTALPIGRPVTLPLDQLLDLKGSWQKGKFFYQPEVFWTRGLWERSGACVDAGLFYSMDYELWLRMARSGAQIVHVPDTLALFRIHEKQKTSGELRFLPELRSVRANFKRGLR
jgi:GT2 family glycosyltransferase